MSIFATAQGRDLGSQARELRRRGPSRMTGRREDLSNMQLLMLGADRNPVNPIVNIGLGLLDNEEDQRNYLRAMFPEAQGVTQSKQGWVIWRPRQPTDAVDQRFYANFNAFPRLITAPDEKGRQQVVEPTFVNPIGLDSSDLMRLGPTGVAAGLGIAASIGTASPAGIAVVEGVLEATRAAIGQFGTPGEKEDPATAILIAGGMGAAFGGVGQFGANIPPTLLQRAGPTGAAGRRVARESREADPRLPQGQRQPRFRRTRAVLRQAATGRGLAGAIPEPRGRPRFTLRDEPPTLDLDSAEIVETLGPTAVENLKAIDEIRRIKVFDPASRELRPTGVSLNTAQLTQSQMAEDLAQDLIDFPGLARQAEINERELKLLVDQFTGRLRQSVARPVGFVDPANAPETLGNRIRDLVRGRIRNLEEQLRIGPQPLLKRLHSAFEQDPALRVFIPNQTVGFIVNQLRTTYADASPIRQALLRELQGLVTARTIGRRLRLSTRPSLMTSRRFFAKRELVGETIKATDAPLKVKDKLQRQLYRHMQLDLDDAVRRLEAMPDERLGKGGRMLRVASNSIKEINDKLREFKSTAFARVVGQLDDTPIPVRGKAPKPLSPEKIVRNLEKLSPSDKRAFFQVATELDPETSARLRDVLMERILTDALPDPHPVTGALDLKAFDRIMGQQGDNIRAIIGDESAGQLTRIRGIVRLLNRPSRRASARAFQDDLPMPSIIGRAANFRVIANQMNRAYRTSNARILMMFRKRHVSRLMSEPDLSRSFLRAMKFPRKSAAAARAFERFARLMQDSDSTDEQTGTRLVADEKAAEAMLDAEAELRRETQQRRLRSPLRRRVAPEPTP